MAYEYEEIVESQKIFYHLLQYGKLEEQDEKEMFRSYVENDRVMYLVKSQGEMAKSQIERYGNVIYLIPDADNTFLGFTKTELKNKLCKSNATEKDFYLVQFIILTLLASFYDGQGGRCKSRDMIKMGVLQNEVSDRLREGAEKEEEQEDLGVDMAGREKSVLDYRSMRQAFESLKSGEKDRKSKTTKEGVMNSVLSFLEEQGLILYIREDEIIKTTDKLDNLMEMKILNMTNYKSMMQAMGVEINE